MGRASPSSMSPTDQARGARLDGPRGLVLEVAVTDGSFGRLMIHFHGDAAVLAPHHDPLAAAEEVRRYADHPRVGAVFLPACAMPSNTDAAAD